jgi:hypothetical protein
MFLFVFFIIYSEKLVFIRIADNVRVILTLFYLKISVQNLFENSRLDDAIKLFVVFTLLSDKLRNKHFPSYPIFTLQVQAYQSGALFGVPGLTHIR